MNPEKAQEYIDRMKSLLLALEGEVNDEEVEEDDDEEEEEVEE